LSTSQVDLKETIVRVFTNWMKKKGGMEDSKDDFVGNGDNCLTIQEERATAAHLENAVYLDWFDVHKEIRLQEGFGSGYEEVFEIAANLGELLGRVSAQFRIQKCIVGDDGNHLFDTTTASSLAKRFFTAMKNVSDGNESSKNTKQLLVELQSEVANVLVQLSNARL